MNNFHFIAIGGVGQSALAKILLINGCNVSGSDVVESKYTKMLEELGAKIFIGHSKDNVDEGQTIVLSSAIKEDNPELIQAKALGLTLLHRSDVLKIISEKYPSFIGFSGTHGKTTTSALCSYILEKIGAKPSYAVGGTIIGLDTNANAYENSKVFIAELDESDGTIVKYSPTSVVINNLEPDHFDFYKNGEKDLINQFDLFLKNLSPKAKIFVNIDDRGVLDFLKTVRSAKLIKYSIKNRDADYFAGDIKVTDKFNLFNIYKKGKFLGEVKTQIKGKHNVVNTLSVISVLIEEGYNFHILREPLFEFLGTKRRFETVYDNEIRIIDDYAHHPTEILATLNSAKKQNISNLKIVFQPHRYTRLKALWKEFLTSFDLADELFVVDTYSAGDEFDPVFNSENFAKEIKHKNVKYIKGDMDNAADEILKYLKNGDCVITIGAGDVTKIGYKLRSFYETR